MATAKKSAAAAGEGMVEQDEFARVSPGRIVFGKQIRSPEDQNGEPFLGLRGSVRAMGVVEPVEVAPQDDKYLCLAGERRVRAALAEGLATIPVRIIRNVETRDAVIALQLTENLQRAALDAIDEGAAYLEFFQVRHGELTVGEVLSHFITYGRSPENLEKGISDTVSEIVNISGKSSRSVQRIISLQILPPEVREAVRAGKITVSQGYTLADNVSHPGFAEILAEALNGSMTNEALLKRFKDYGKTKRGRPSEPAAICFRRVDDLKKIVKEKGSGMTAEELFNLLEEIKSVEELVANLKVSDLHDLAMTAVAIDDGDQIAYVAPHLLRLRGQLLRGRC